VALGVDEARPIERLKDDLPALLEGRQRIVYRTGLDEARDRLLLDTVARLRARARGLVSPPLEIVGHGTGRPRAAPQEEPGGGRARPPRGRDHARGAPRRDAARASGRPRVRGRRRCSSTAFRTLGSTGPAYTPIVAGGANATILHYVENDHVLRDGDLLLVDAGAECEYYASDVTRTFPVGPALHEEQRALYEIVLAAQLAAIDAVRPGAAFTHPHEVAVAILCEGLARQRAPPGVRGRDREIRSRTGASTCIGRATGSASTCTTAAPT
jgi:Xaa-Pro aminopeptidase